MARNYSEDVLRTFDPNRSANGIIQTSQNGFPGPYGQFGEYVECAVCNSPTYSDDFARLAAPAPTALTAMNIRYDEKHKLYSCELARSNREATFGFRDLCVKPWQGNESFWLTPRKDEETGYVIALEHVPTGMEVHGWERIVADLFPGSMDEDLLLELDENNSDESIYTVAFGMTAEFLFSRVKAADVEGLKEDYGLDYCLQVHRADYKPGGISYQRRPRDRCQNSRVYRLETYPLVGHIHHASDNQVTMMHTIGPCPTRWVPVIAYIQSEIKSIRHRPIAFAADVTHVYSLPIFDNDLWNDLQVTPLLSTELLFYIHPIFTRNNGKIKGYYQDTGRMGVEGWKMVAEAIRDEKSDEKRPLRFKVRRINRGERGGGMVLQIAPHDKDFDCDGPAWQKTFREEAKGLDVSNLPAFGDSDEFVAWS